MLIELYCAYKRISQVEPQTEPRLTGMVVGQILIFIARFKVWGHLNPYFAVQCMACRICDRMSVGWGLQ